MDDEKEIYLEECGCMCPNGKDCDCGWVDKDGLCTLEEPWFDCGDFMAAYPYDIDAASLRISDMESEEEDEEEDDW